MSERTTWTISTVLLILMLGSTITMLVHLTQRVDDIEKARAIRGEQVKALEMELHVVRERQDVVRERLSANETNDRLTTERLDRYEVRINMLEEKR